MKIESYSDLIGPKGGMAGRNGVIHNNKIPSSRSHFFRFRNAPFTGSYQP